MLLWVDTTLFLINFFIFWTFQISTSTFKKEPTLQIFVLFLILNHMITLFTSLLFQLSGFFVSSKLTTFTINLIQLAINVDIVFCFLYVFNILAVFKSESLTKSFFSNFNELTVSIDLQVMMIILLG